MTFVLHHDHDAAVPFPSQFHSDDFYVLNIMHLGDSGMVELIDI